MHVTPTIIAVNHRADTDRRRALPDTWSVWPTTEPAGVTYHRIATTAVDERWDQTTVVIQDDVRFSQPPTVWDRPFILYGGWKTDHACPRAFAADADTWRRLAEAWAPEPDRLCDSFRAVLLDTRRSLLLDQIRHLEDPGSRSWPRRRAA